MPRNSNFRLRCDHRFRPKSDRMVMAPNQGGDPLGSILVPMGSHWVNKKGQNHKKLPCLEILYFRLPGGHRFRPKSDLTVVAPNHGGDPLVSNLVQMGFHWVQKIGQNRKKLPFPKIRIFNYPVIIDFGQNQTFRLWWQIRVQTPWGPSWGQ